MAIAVLKGKNVDINLWAQPHEVESVALDQLKNIAALPWVFRLAVMPDVHFGKGATVGSVIAMKSAVSPSAVGVDIGCGMAAIKTSLMASDLPDSLEFLYDQLASAIPVNFHGHSEPLKIVQKLPLWKRFKDLDEKVSGILSKAMQQCGTLGGGNHFVELCLDERGDQEPGVWMMLHSGSRNIGKTLAEIHIARAKKLAHNADLPDRDLAVFLTGTPEMAAYRHDLFWAQEYAMENRRAMLDQYKTVLKANFPQIEFEEPILCHHNYVSEEIHFGEQLLVTRKGAISAQKGELGIIPGSMGTKSYIVEGLGNEDSLCSASHGAGRRMSRNKAKKEFTIDDLIEQTKGVCCKKDYSVIDEIPGAYKNIDTVMENQRDLVRIVASLKQVLCLKGGEKSAGA